MRKIEPEDLKVVYLDSPGVQIIHLPTNLVAVCSEQRSQHKNKQQAFLQLKQMLEDLDKETD